MSFSALRHMLLGRYDVPCVWLGGRRQYRRSLWNLDRLLLLEFGLWEFSNRFWCCKQRRQEDRKTGRQEDRNRHIHHQPHRQGDKPATSIRINREPTEKQSGCRHHCSGRRDGRRRRRRRRRRRFQHVYSFRFFALSHSALRFFSLRHNTALLLFFSLFYCSLFLLLMISSLACIPLFRHISPTVFPAFAWTAAPTTVARGAVAVRFVSVTMTWMTNSVPFSPVAFAVPDLMSTLIVPMLLLLTALLMMMASCFVSSFAYSFAFVSVVHNPFLSCFRGQCCCLL